jgi:membrane-bound lytic murein transglycosylase MltF
MDAYQNMGPTTDSFIDLMRRRKSKVMGPDKWNVVKNKVSKENTISMFNLKYGPKRKMLKVQYFKHPNIT